jgi:hypothetical protein
MAKKEVMYKGAPGGFYFLTFIGALVYFVQRSNGFGEFLVAVLKACVWPAFIIHRALELMGL